MDACEFFFNAYYSSELFNTSSFERKINRPLPNQIVKFVPIKFCVKSILIVVVILFFEFISIPVRAMGCLTTKSCFGCFSLRTGGILMGWLGIISGGLGILCLLIKLDIYMRMIAAQNISPVASFIACGKCKYYYYYI